MCRADNLTTCLETWKPQSPETLRVCPVSRPVMGLLTRSKPCVSATSSTTNPIQTGFRSNPVLRDDRSATNSLRPSSQVSHFLGRARCGDAHHRTTLIHMCAGIRISLSSDIQRDGAAAEPEGFAVTT
jgi:hypothetical protein